jgi:hypothetical protein
MEEKIELCEDCIHANTYRENPEAFEEVLGRFAASGFSCEGVVRELAPGTSPFAVPLPKMRKQCGLDKALSLALEAEGYDDTPEDSTGRQMFFRDELKLSPIDAPD